MRKDSGSSDKRSEKEKQEAKAKKSPDPKLNRDINRRVQDERFPEAMLSKNPRKDTEKEAGSQESPSFAKATAGEEARRSKGQE